MELPDEHSCRAPRRCARRRRPGDREALRADPLSAAALAQAVLDAGFPAGAVSVVQGRGDVGRALVAHDGVDGIGFVGSHETGEALVRAAGMKRTLIEASGNGPQIVCDDPAIDAAAKAAVFGPHYVAGQCCVATERVLVQADVHDELVDRILAHAARICLGDPLDETTTMGPLNNEAVAAEVDAHLADGRARVPRCSWVANAPVGSQPTCSTS